MQVDIKVRTVDLQIYPQKLYLATTHSRFCLKWYTYHPASYTYYKRSDCVKPNCSSLLSGIIFECLKHNCQLWNP